MVNTLGQIEDAFHVRPPGRKREARELGEFAGPGHMRRLKNKFTRCKALAVRRQGQNLQSFLPSRPFRHVVRTRGKHFHLALRGNSEHGVRLLQAEPGNVVAVVIEAFVFYRGHGQHQHLVLQACLCGVLARPHANRVMRQRDRLVVPVARRMRDTAFHSGSSRSPPMSWETMACEKYSWAIASESCPIWSRTPASSASNSSRSRPASTE